MYVLQHDTCYKPFSLWLVVVVRLYFARKTQRAHEVVLIEFMRFEWRLEKSPRSLDFTEVIVQLQLIIFRKQKSQSARISHSQN